MMVVWQIVPNLFFVVGIFGRQFEQALAVFLLFLRPRFEQALAIFS